MPGPITRARHRARALALAKPELELDEVEPLSIELVDLFEQRLKRLAREFAVAEHERCRGVPIEQHLMMLMDQSKRNLFEAARTVLRSTSHE